MLTKLLRLIGFRPHRATPRAAPMKIVLRRETTADVARRVIIHPQAQRLLHPRTVKRFEEVAAGALPSRTDVKALRQFDSYLLSDVLGGGNA